MADIAIAVIGAGVIGRTHLEAIARAPGYRLAGIVEPGPDGPALAAELHAPLFADVDALIADRPDGAVVATPNETHVPIALRLVEAGIPVLIEKPVAGTVAEAMPLLDAIDRNGVPALVGHHRRYNPIIDAAFAHVRSTAFGRLVMASVSCTLMKPAPYFDLPWRRTPGVGGPLLINLIHEVDLLRHLFGEVETITAIVSNRQRGLPVEDSAGIALQFANGGMASIAISDAACGPWAWDVSAGENLGRFPAHPVQSHLFAGTAGSLSLPDLTVWTHPGERSWTNKMHGAKLEAGPGDSYDRQLTHFGAVIRGDAEPLVSAREGAMDLAIVEAVAESGRTGRSVRLDATGLAWSPIAGETA